MLRALVAALLLANLVFLTWSYGWLDGLIGTRSIGDREPERLSRQVRPEIVRIVPSAAATASAPGAGDAASSPVSSASSSASSAATAQADAAATPVALVCLEVGPFSDAAVSAAQSAARAALPTADVTIVKTAARPIWMVYMGRYADQEAMKKKEEELKRRRLSFEEVRGNLTPGLSLGRFDDRNDATKALEQFAQQGIRTARIIEYTPAASVQMLRIEKADAPLVSQATGLKLAPLGKGFVPCATKPS